MVEQEMQDGEPLVPAPPMPEQRRQDTQRKVVRSLAIILGLVGAGELALFAFLLISEGREGASRWNTSLLVLLLADIGCLLTAILLLKGYRWALGTAALIVQVRYWPTIIGVIQSLIAQYTQPNHVAAFPDFSFLEKWFDIFLLIYNLGGYLVLSVLLVLTWRWTVRSKVGM